MTTKSWNHYNPVNIKAGASMLNHLPDLMEKGNWLLVTTPGFTRRGTTDQIRKLLPNIELVVYDKVTPNPELDDLETATQQYKSSNFQGLIALGGGSVIDAAKVLAVTIPSKFEQPLTQILRQGLKHTWQTKLSLIAIPTTSGTGAEVTPFATVWDQTEHKKHSVVGDKVFPDIALLDPQLTLSLPEKETLYTGLDAVSHALESLWNINRTPISQSFAIQALELAEAALPLVLTNLGNLDARIAMQQASVLAGLAISQTRTAIAHSISYPLTSHFNIPHGLACSFSLPILMEINKNILARSKSEEILFSNLLEMINKLDLSTHMKRYASMDQILFLHNEMLNPSRSDNYNGVSLGKIEEIVRSSLTKQ